MKFVTQAKVLDINQKDSFWEVFPQKKFSEVRKKVSLP